MSNAAEMFSFDPNLTREKNLSRNFSPAMGRGIDSMNRVWNGVAKLHRLADRYDNPMPNWFLAPIAELKLPTLDLFYFMIPTYEIDAGPPERGVAGQLVGGGGEHQVHQRLRRQSGHRRPQRCHLAVTQARLHMV
jgi:hypothetical protein